MQDRLLNNHGDLYGRVTYEIKLAPKDCGMAGLCLRERLLQLRRPDQGCAWRVRRGIRKLCLVTSAYIANFLSEFVTLATYACCRASGVTSRAEEREQKNDRFAHGEPHVSSGLGASLFVSAV